MCTLIAYHRCREDWPLVVAANRDERLDRPAAPPRAVGRSPRIWAGVDREAGGTWLGLNAHGLVVGLTNAARAVREPGRRSRGLLVMDLLMEPDAEAAARRLEAIPPGRYNPFQVFFADARRAFLGTLNDMLSVESLPGGVHVLTNAAPGDPEEPRRAEVVRLLGVDGPAEAKSIDDLKQILARHAPVPERSVCLHRPSFGTRSSSVIAVGGRRAPLYLHAEGPPCCSAWADLSPARGDFRTPAMAGAARGAVRRPAAPAASGRQPAASGVRRSPARAGSTGAARRRRAVARGRRAET